MMALNRKICFNSEMMDLSSNVKTLTKLACKVVFFEKNSLQRQFGIKYQFLYSLRSGKNGKNRL
jgi:hypothetical protein